MSRSLVVAPREIARKPKPSSRYVVGFHAENRGETFSVAWLGVDGNPARRVSLYDSFVFGPRVTFPTIAAELRRHGRWLPIAWKAEDEEFAMALRDLDCSVLSEGYEETPEVARRAMMEIDERINTGSFVVENPSAQVAWRNEAKGFSLKDGLVPQVGAPLMSATRHAYKHLSFARGPDEQPWTSIEYPPSPDFVASGRR
jgi:hypothetical protein